MQQTIRQYGKRTVYTPWTSSPWTYPLPCSVRVRVKSGVSRVRIRVGSVGLELVLGLELGLGLWFGLGGRCPGGEMYDSRQYCVVCVCGLRD